MNIKNLVDLPSVRRFCGRGILAAAGALLVASAASAETFRLVLGANGTYASAYNDSEMLEVPQGTSKQAQTSSASLGETWYLSAETTTPGYQFDTWALTPATSGATIADPTSPETTVILDSGATFVLTAKFKKQQCVLTVSDDGNLQSSVPSVGDHAYAAGQVVKFGNPVPVDGYVFDHWADPSAPESEHPNVDVDYSSVPPKYSITMDTDYQVMAVFKKQLVITHNNINPTMPSEIFEQQVGEGTKPLVAVPSETVVISSTERWACNGWTAGGPQIPATGAAASYQFTQKIDQDNALTWSWIKQYNVTAGIGNGQGAIAGLNYAIGDNANWFNAGSAFSATAIPAAGYVFAGWVCNPSDALSAAQKGNRMLEGVTVGKSMTLLATFQLLSEDSDADGLPDSWEQAMGLDPFSSDGANGGAADPDNDGLSNLAEYLIFADGTNRTGRVAYAYPLNCDSDGDGLDDGWEYLCLGNDKSEDFDSESLLSPVVDPGTFAPNGRYGRNGNPDGDFRWDTATGWELGNLPLTNIMEYEGPDGIAPYIFESVAPGAVSSDGWVNTLSKTVTRRVKNSADTGDGSLPLNKDSDNDGFDDGFEYSWDQWHQTHGGTPLADQAVFPGITEVVQDWDPAGFRPFNPAVAATTGNLDQDYLYGFVDNGLIPQIANGFNDIDEYNASLYATNGNAEAANFYPVTRQYRASTGLRWCTNPFVWDSDYDGMSDGWEITFGFDPWFVEPVTKLNPDNDYFAVDVDNGLRHNEVYAEYGFNPHTGWGPKQYDGGVNTAPFTAFDEFLGVMHAVDCTLANQAEWRSTNPRVHDQDRDGIWDGWELYVDLDPATELDAGVDGDLYSTYYFDPSETFPELGLDEPHDGLTNFQEFNSNHTPAEGLGVAYTVPGWANKTFPTDPWDFDTDSDQLIDGEEKDYFNLTGGTTTQQVVTGVDSNGVEIVETITVPAQTGPVNGGLCPTAVDTDGDALPDAWEAFYGTIADDEGFGTCNGTISDAFDDPDRDGLANYQEYLMGAIAHWQFQNNAGEAIWEAGKGLGAYEPTNFFDPNAVAITGVASEGQFYKGYGGRVAHDWDDSGIAFLTGNGGLGGVPAFSTGDPLNYDTDVDGMDDYWEIFHGLNPLFGTVDVVREKVGTEVSMFDCDQNDELIGWENLGNFREYSWLAGNLLSDSDQDNLSDIDESLQPRVPTAKLPPNYHSDPSPIWMTDISSEDSFVNLYFATGNMPWYWSESLPPEPPTYIFDFEMNEGFDTDGDFVADRAELVNSIENPGVTDPLDTMTPVKRRALYLNGDAAARTVPQFGHRPYDLAQFTIDCWVRPEVPANGSDQIILERSAVIRQGSSMQPVAVPVVNFRLGLDQDGIPFVAYNGSQNPLLFTEAKASAFGPLEADTWYHLAATYGGSFRTDGQWTGKLRLYVNGRTVSSVDSSEIPFGGWVIGYNESGAIEIPVGGATGMPIVIGAGDYNPDGRVDGHVILVGADAGLAHLQPDLHSFFQGWVDQVRIWNDPLSQAEIEQYMSKRFTRAEVIAESTDSLAGGHGLLYSYSFDNLPDPDYDPVFPKGYEMLDGRPANWNQIPFWGLADDRSEWYDDYRVLPWIENQVQHNPYDVPRDQASADSPVLGNTNAFFANTANPYTIIYKTAASFEDERHPFLDTWIEDVDALEDPRAIAMKADLLPLRWAVADEDVEMWDNLGTGRNEDNLDSDGDGLPDWWEIANGLDYLDATGRNGRYGDIDGDGLSNYAEYLAGTDPWSADTDCDGIDDFNDRSGNLADDQRTYGERLTDNDFVEDSWEAKFDAYYASPVIYDAHLDRDEDGWSNWSEARAHTDPDKAYRLDTEAGIHHGECPAPVINATVRYDGVNKAGSLVVHAFTRPSMDGEPDAVIVGNARHVDSVGIMWFVTELAGTIVVVEDADGFNSEIPSGNGIVPGSVVITDANGTVVHIDNGDGTFGSDATKIDYATGRMRLQSGAFASYSYRVAVEWPMTCTFDTVASGWLREGRNYFWAFLDVDGNNVWNAGEPAGLADGYVHDVGYDSLELSFTLTDDAPGFARLHFAEAVDPASVAEHTVAIENAGNYIFKETLRGPRAYLHEGDFIYCEDNSLVPADAQGNPGQLGGYGLDWGVTAKDPIYKWYVDGVFMGAFTNHYAATLGAPVAVWPKGAIHQQVRPEFRFRLAPEATMFQLQIRTADSHQVVYDGKHLAPPRRREGTDLDMCVWEFPYCVNQDLPNGAIFANGGYQWRVRGFTPHTYKGSAWSSGPDESSAWQEFAMDVTTDAKTTYRAAWLQVEVKYYGKALEDSDMVGKLRVQAFNTASFNDRPVAEVVVDEPGIVTIAGLNPGNYFVRAFVDQDKDFERDNWETWGYVRQSDNADWPFTPKTVEANDVGVKALVPEIVMQDCDTDQDGIPDSWEYRYNSAKNDWLAVYGIQSRPVASGISAAISYTDFDNDGLSDFAEYLYGANPTIADSDNDGIDDANEVALGFASIESNALRITSVPGSKLSWAWDGTIADTGVTSSKAARSAKAVAKAPALGKEVTYVLERATSLLDQDWEVVGSGTTADSVGTLAVPDEDLDSLFYRVRAIVK